MKHAFGETSNTNPWHIKFPKFSGDDPNGWIYKAGQYFYRNQIDESQWLNIASYNIEEEALQFYRWFNNTRGQFSWKDLTIRLLQRFGPKEFEDPAGALSKLRQTGTVTEYQKEFERLSNLVHGLSEEFLVSCFISGLRDDIQPGVRIFKPKDLLTAIELARLQEEQLCATIKTPPSTFSTQHPNQQFRPSPYQQFRPHSPRPWLPQNHLSSNSVPNKTQSSLLGPPPKSTPPKSTPPFQRISANEMKERREKGLYYHCDEKYSFGHTCKNPRIFLLEGCFPESDCDAGESDDPVEDNNGEQSPEISLHEIVSTNTPQTMRLVGSLCNKQVSVLIDSGSTHNFLDPQVVTRLNIPISAGGKFKVMVANGTYLESEGRCLNVKISLQQVPVVADFFVLPLGGCQVVLGAQWLRTLGPITWDFTAMVMSFKLNGMRHHLKASESDSVDVLEATEFTKEFWQSGKGLMLHLISLQEVQVMDDVQPGIKVILDEFTSVFSEALGLPSSRSHDHKFSLLDSHGPVNVRPYSTLIFRRMKLKS